MCFLLLAGLSNEREVEEKKVESIEQVMFYYQRQLLRVRGAGPA